MLALFQKKNTQKNLQRLLVSANASDEEAVNNVDKDVTEIDD